MAGKLSTPILLLSLNFALHILVYIKQTLLYNVTVGLINLQKHPHFLKRHPALMQQPLLSPDKFQHTFFLIFGTFPVTMIAPSFRLDPAKLLPQHVFPPFRLPLQLVVLLRLVPPRVHCFPRLLERVVPLPALLLQNLALLPAHLQHVK